MLAVRNLQVAYGRFQAIWDVSFDVPEGEIVALFVAQKALQQYRGTPFEAPLRALLARCATISAISGSHRLTP